MLPHLVGAYTFCHRNTPKCLSADRRPQDNRGNYCLLKYRLHSALPRSMEQILNLSGWLNMVLRNWNFIGSLFDLKSTHRTERDYQSDNQYLRKETNFNA